MGVNVLVKGKTIGAVTDVDGNFSLTVEEALPITLSVSSVGYTSKEVVAEEPTDVLVVQLKYQTLLGQEVVVSASRVEESILESPVSIEKLDIRDIQAAAAPSIYDQIANLKGIDVSTQSLTFKSINPRGFGINGNPRTVQLIDGIDNQAPGLNFPVGNIAGIPELDLESIEILPGAASALYGPNAINGIILMRSKSPFEYQGLSAMVKMGVTHVDGVDDDPALYQNYALRYAQAFNDKFAFKIAGEYLRAGDFRAVDYRDQQGGVVERSDEDIDPTDRPDRRTYDGVNVYGDPLVNLGLLAQSNPDLAPVRALLPLGEAGNFTPTGYTEADFIDNTTESLKVGGALHYRITDGIELLGQYNYGTGSTVYTANDRFVLDNFNIWTSKLELQGDNFFVRGYTTRENSGDTYAANTLTSLINAQTTIPEYVSTFTGARLQGLSTEAAHGIARQASDALRAENLQNGRFEELADSLRAIPISEGGAQFLSRTSLWHAEGMYNFSDIIDVAEIIVGANFRRYNLESDGTLFALQENGEEYNIDEWGSYLQVSKELFNDKLDLTASARYDKNEYFDGQFSPRISGVLTVQDNHNFRASFQRGFRIPATQDQFISLDVVTRRLVGSNEELVDRFNFRTNQVYLVPSVQRAQANFRSTGDLEGSIALLEPVEIEAFDTEKVSTYEVGYKGIFQEKLLIDAYYYYSAYTDLIGEQSFVQSAGPANDPDGDGLPPFVGEEDPAGIVQNTINLQTYGFDINTEGTINTQGFAMSAEYLLARGFSLGGNVAYNKILNPDEVSEGVRIAFNTPEWRYNIKLANRKVTDLLGFSVLWRWQQAFFWESPLGSGVIPAYQTLDAQISYKLPAINSTVKLGGSNVLNERYTTSFANPRIGALYYVSITFDELLN